MKNNQKPNTNNNSFTIPKYIILTGKLLQRVSPDLASRFVAKIFERPLKFDPPERELMMRESAKKNILSIDTIRKKIMVYI